MELSAQNVLDCSGINEFYRCHHSRVCFLLLNVFSLYSQAHYGNNGCKQGSTSFAFSYIIGSNGVDTDKSYPYEGEVDNYESLHEVACHYVNLTGRCLQV